MTVAAPPAPVEIESPPFLCKLCRATEPAATFQLQRRRKNVEPFPAVVCASCGLFQDVYDWPAAVRWQRSNTRDPAAEPAAEPKIEIEANWAKARQFAGMLDDMGLVRERRILDIGCGNGIFLRECLDRGAASVTGQEFLSDDRAAYARDRLGIDDIRSVPFTDRAAWPDGEFDVVCSFDVVEHVHDVADFFAECVRIARPGGTLFHATPGSDSLTNRLGRTAVGWGGRAEKVRTIGTSLCNLSSVDNYTGTAHVSLMGARPLRWLVERHGLHLMQATYVSSYSYSDDHYATLVHPVNKLPRPAGTAVFRVARRVARNKLVFAARKPAGRGPV